MQPSKKSFFERLTGTNKDEEMVETEEIESTGLLFSKKPIQRDS